MSDAMWNQFAILVDRVSLDLNTISDVSKAREAVSGSDRFLKHYGALRLDRGLEVAEKTYMKYSSQWSELIYKGKQLARHILDTRQPPKPRMKAFEQAARLFTMIKRAPRKPVTWWAKNYKHVKLLQEARNWGERSAVSEESVAKVGPFTVHNTIGEDPTMTHKAVEKAIQFIQASRVPKLKGVLYGDVYIVGKLHEPRTLAWYHPSDDKVYVRQHLKSGKGEVHNLIHEFGHRYWMRGMISGAQKGMWEVHHASVRNSAEASSSPDEEEFERRLAEFNALSVGDNFPKLFKGWMRGVKVTELNPEGREGWVVRKKGRDTFMDRRSVERALRRSVERSSAFVQVANSYPTPYASTDAHEHFCEALAMYVMGTLPLEHKEEFERIVIRGESLDRR